MAKVILILPGFPAKTNRGLLGFCTIALIKGKKLYLWDTGQGMDRSNLIERLKELKIKPENIDFIILSHLHFDHIINVDLFPNAQIIISKKEIEYSKNPASDDLYTHPKIINALLNNRSIRLIEHDTDIEEDIKLILTPGHTPGSLSAVINSENETIVLAGDAAKYRKELLTRKKFDGMIWGKPEDVKKSIERILELADIIFPGHDFPLRVIDHQYIVWDKCSELSIIYY